jgi:hypothetical protein
MNSTRQEKRPTKDHDKTVTEVQKAFDKAMNEHEADLRRLEELIKSL